MKYLVFLLALAALPARADLVWTFENVTFADGGTLADGSFFTFLDDGTFNWNIAVSGGSSAFPDFDYTPTDSYVPNASTPTPAANDGAVWLFGPDKRVLLLNLPVDMPSPKDTTTTGPVTIPLGVSWECYNCTPWRYILGGEVVISGSYAGLTSNTIPPIGVPEPGVFGGLFAGCLYLLRRHIRA